MPKELDLTLYVVLDPEHRGGRALEDIAVAAAKGGATLFQLRDKRNDVGATAAQARSLLLALRPYAKPLLINDRVDIALATGADGVHLGQSDMPPQDARRILGGEAIIGLTVRSLEEAAEAPLEYLDYISIGGVFPTGSKKQVENPIGLDGLREIACALRARGADALCAISGISERNGEAVLRCGVDGFAVITAVSEAEDPLGAARKLRSMAAK